MRFLPILQRSRLPNQRVLLHNHRGNLQVIPAANHLRNPHNLLHSHRRTHRRNHQDNLHDSLLFSRLDSPPDNRLDSQQDIHHVNPPDSRQANLHRSPLLNLQVLLLSLRDNLVDNLVPSLRLLPHNRPVNQQHSLRDNL